MHNNKTSIKIAHTGTGILILTVITAITGMAGWQSPVQSRLSITQDHGYISVIRGKPLIFEFNKGQTEKQVHYRSRGRDYTVNFTAQGVNLKLGHPNDKMRDSATTSNSPKVLSIRPVGANPKPTILGEQQLTTRHHYLTGRLPDEWHTNIPTFAKVRYADIYPGIDLLFYGNESRLEYDFIVAPKTAPDIIRLDFPGADDITVNINGDLLLTLSDRQVIQPAPLIYQEADGARKIVAGGYVLDDQQRVSFKIAAYNPALPLIIDPVLVYSSFFGGSGDDKALGLAIDNAGNTYITGSTSSPDLPTSSGALDTTCGSDGTCDAVTIGGTTIRKTDFFITKMDPSGNPMYTTYLGGSQSDVATGIAVNNAGEVYLSGYTTSVDFPTTPGAFDTTCSDTSPADGLCDEGVEATVTRLNASGNALVYSSYLGGGDDDYAYAVAIDSAGAAYLTGSTASGDFPLANGVFAGEEDVFAAKLDATGATLLYATYLGGIGTDIGLDITVDSTGNAYLTGYTASADYPTTAGTLDQLCGATGSCDGLVDDNNDGIFDTISTFDAFVTKLDNTGANMVYSTYLGGERYDYGNAITVDAAGNAYVAGETRSASFPPPLSSAAYQNTIAGSYDGYVTRLNAAGTALDFFSYIGGGSGDTVIDLAIDSSGDIYLFGSTFSRDFPVLTPFQMPPPQRQDNTVIVYNSDAWLAKLSGDGSTLRHSSTFGGQHNDYGTAMAIDTASNAYITGYTISADMPATSAANQGTHGNILPGNTVNGADSYVAIVNDSAGDLSVTLTGTPNTVTQGEIISYLAIVTNLGTLNAEGVRLNYEAIADTASVTATPSQGSCSIPVPGNKINCELGMIPANGGSANVTYTITPNGASQLQNTVVVGARMSDSNAANNSDSVTTTVNSISFAAGPDRDDHGDHNGHDDGSSSGSTSVFILLAGLLVLVSRRRRTRHIFLPAHL